MMAGQRGSALVMAMLLVVVVGALTAAIANGGREVSRDTIDDRAALQALHAAEGGLELARCEVANDADYRGERIEIGVAVVDVRVARQLGDAPRWHVVATARCWPRGEHGAPYQRRVATDLILRDGMPAAIDWRELR